MDESRKHLISTLGMLLGLGLFLWAGLQMSRKIEPYWTWFYCFAWWSFILFSQSLLHRRGAQSLLFEQPGRFFLLAFFSISLWLVFEVWNFRLNNWEYHNVPGQITARWLGYAISFATVVPGLFTMEHLLDHFGVFGSLQTAGRAPNERFDGCLFWTGAILLLLPLIWPRFFFPLVWGGFVLLLEPVNYRLGAPSLLRQWREGSSRKVFLLLLSGLLCGLLWEFWNFWAGSRWRYTIPYVGWFKIFEMPVLGFLGFPPFALECYGMAGSFLLLFERIREQRSPSRRFYLRLLFLTGMIAFDLLVFYGIDHYTVAAYSR